MLWCSVMRSGTSSVFCLILSLVTHWECPIGSRGNRGKHDVPAAQISSTIDTFLVAKGTGRQITSIFSFFVLFHFLFICLYIFVVINQLDLHPVLVSIAHNWKLFPPILIWAPLSSKEPQVYQLLYYHRKECIMCVFACVCVHVCVCERARKRERERERERQKERERNTLRPMVKPEDKVEITEALERRCYKLSALHESRCSWICINKTDHLWRFRNVM